MAEDKEIIKVNHHRSSNFTSDYASGAVVAGPTTDGMYHMIFYSESLRISSETGTKTGISADGKAEYALKIEESDIEQFREEKARISMTDEGMRNLFSILEKKFNATEGEK